MKTIREVAKELWQEIEACREEVRNAESKGYRNIASEWGQKRAILFRIHGQIVTCKEFIETQ